MEHLLNKPLSPSRANQFRDCQLLYRYRTIDRLPEAPSQAAVRGTLVHSVLEKMFETQPELRDVDTVISYLPGALDAMLEESPINVYAIDGDLSWTPEVESFDVHPKPSVAAVTQFLDVAEGLVRSYFSLETPSMLNPTALELKVAHKLSSGTDIHGIIDRFETTADGAVRISDYKTGKAPDPRWAAKSWFQMLFYALVIWREKGVIAQELRLIFLGNSQILTKQPTEAELLEIENQINQIASEIEHAIVTGEFFPRKSGLCQFCSHQAICPEFGGKILPLPYPVIER
ncbi:MAG: hypothetical protein RIS75_1230 [Actinomycetota bacterium]